MIEVAMVFSNVGGIIWWPSSKGNAGSIPDSRHLWDVLWESRAILGGVAHTHPWDGPGSPSGTDLTTFAALERGLGMLLTWPIVTMTHVDYYVWSGGQYRLNLYPPFEEHKGWHAAIEEMRRLSQDGLHTHQGDQNG
jgi:hypothetical protein